MTKYDVCIIGAGPCGIFCAVSAKERGLSVALIECGNRFDSRKCLVDEGDDCIECSSCNVISGFGGCVHYGDSAKLSYYPSGRELYRKIPNDYDRLLQRACNYWRVDKKEFVENNVFAKDETYEVKVYPVRVMKSSEIKSVVEETWHRIQELGIDYYHLEMKDFVEKNDGSIEVLLNDETKVLCKNLVLAMGRHGIDWLKRNAESKSFVVQSPIPSIGVRFEMPRQYMIPLGKLHPDFKFRMEYKGYKYKSFCYCGGEHGGRLKFANYGRYTLLDGHVLTEDDDDSKYANFALLRQVIQRNESIDNAIIEKNGIIADYVSLFGGKPIYQSYESFKKCDLFVDRGNVSAKYVKQGEVYRLLKSRVEEYCYVAEKVFQIIAQHASCTVDEIIRNTKVIGLELEGLWDRIITDEFFRVKGRKVYIGGDCGGETQGILQATISGIRIGEGLIV